MYVDPTAARAPEPQFKFDRLAAMWNDTNRSRSSYAANTAFLGGAGSFLRLMGTAGGTATVGLPASFLGQMVSRLAGGGGANGGTGGAVGVDQQRALIEEMRVTNQQAFILQTLVQHESQRQTSRTNIAKTDHDARMSTIRNMKA